MEVRTMTTMQKGPEVTTPKATAPKVTVPEVLTEEHHAALKTAWEMPAYERGVPPTPTLTPGKPKPYRSLLIGLVAGAAGLGIGFAAGYVVSEQLAEPAAPIVIEEAAAGPVDANGLNLGRRVAPFDTMAPTPLPVAAATDANGLNLGRRVAPFDTMAPTPLAQAAYLPGVSGGRP
jgi:hypothetical protein